MLALTATKQVQKFCNIASVSYHSMPSSDEHEMEHNYSNKMTWGRSGVAALKSLAQSLGATCDVKHNKSGSIDRGYVSGFIGKNGRYVYVSINDGMKDILFRTAQHAKDYTGGSNNTKRIDENGFGRVAMFAYQHLNS